MNEYKYMIVKGKAGLGNRILSALTGILYARLSGRKLIIDWSDPVYSNDGTNVFHHYFRCSSVNPDDHIPITDSVSPAIWRGRLQETGWDMTERYGNFNDRENWKKFSIDLTKLDYQEDVVVMWTFVDRVDILRCHFKGEFKELGNASRKEILSKLLREDLLLHPHIQKQVENFKSNFRNRKVVGGHVRYSDHRSRLWSIMSRVDKLMKQDSELLIFLASDNVQIEKLFKEKYQHVITKQHWYPEPGLTAHHNTSCPDHFVNGVDALIDLYLSAECDYLIVDTSSIFSYVAVLLTNAPNSNIYNVNPIERGGKRSLRYILLMWQPMLRLGLLSWGPDAAIRHLEITSVRKYLSKKFLYGKSFQQTYSLRKQVNKYMAFVNREEVIKITVQRNSYSLLETLYLIILTRAEAACFICGRLSIMAKNSYEWLLKPLRKQHESRL